MPISVSDIVFVYSGGSDNSDPSLSLGGQPSSVPVPAQAINNIFPDLAGSQVSGGYTDYRCFYVFNDSTEYTITDAKIFVPSQTPDGATVSVGFLARNEQQTITVTGPATSGSLTVSYESNATTIPFSPDPEVFAVAVQSHLNGTGRLTGIRCTGTSSPGAITVAVFFEGNDSNRFHSLIELVSNSIAGSTGVVIARAQSGSPINAVAASTVSATVAPSGVVFGTYTDTNPFLLGDFYPDDGLSVWLRRVTPANAVGVRGDTVKFRIRGVPVANS